MYPPVSILLLVVAISSSVARGDPYGLDSFFTQLFKSDPLAKNDSYELIRPGVKSYLSSPSQHVYDRQRELLSLQTTTPVTVKLVGFSNDQKHELELQLWRYLEVLNKNEHVHVIGTGGTDNHRLSVRSKIQIEVVRAKTSLADTLFKAIQAFVDDKSVLSSSYHQPVPYNVVDNIVRADLEVPLSSYVIYILNLNHQSRKYGYDYQPEVTDVVQSFGKCLGNYWTGRDRYLWFDLAAGPIEYGPALSGDGLILKNEIYPYAAAFHGEGPVQKALSADLASLVWSASQMLFAPALRIPVYYEQELEVHFYHFESPGLEPEKSSKIKWEGIEESFLKESTTGLLFQTQKLIFKKFTIDYDTCPTCAALLSRSTKAYTSRVFMDRYSLFVNEYVDSKQLHYLLAQNQEELENLVGVKHNFMARVVPVYIFDLDMDRVLLLDRYHQAMAFRDMVIAIRTKSYQTISEFNCNSRPTVIHTREIERAVVAGLLQTMWGVTPTHLTWSNQHNSSFVDYTWSLGQTPFGPFSEVSSLSFVQRDAARRNTLYMLLNGTVWGAVDVMDTLAGLGGEKQVLKRNEQVTMNRRWNLFMYKLGKATSAISHFNYDLALFFLKSSEHDLYAVHDLVYKASLQLEYSMVCFTDPPFPWFWLFLFFASSALGTYVWLRRERLFSAKRKRF